MPRRSSLVISGSKFNYFGVPLISPTLNFQLTLLFSGSFDDSITPLMVTEPPFPISTLPPLPLLLISNYSFHNRVKLYSVITILRFSIYYSRHLSIQFRVYGKRKIRSFDSRNLFLEIRTSSIWIQAVNTKLAARNSSRRVEKWAREESGILIPGGTTHFRER